MPLHINIIQFKKKKYDSFIMKESYFADKLYLLVRTTCRLCPYISSLMICDFMVSAKRYSYNLILSGKWYHQLYQSLHRHN